MDESRGIQNENSENITYREGNKRRFSKGQLEFRGVEEVGAFLGKGDNMKLT